MKYLMAVTLLFGAAQAQAMNSYCEAEIRAQEAAPLTAQERSALDYYKGFNRSMEDRYNVVTELVRRHLDDQKGGAKPDGSPVSACLLKTMADGNKESPTAPYAQEAYALRLLAGSGVARNQELAMIYLERAAQWRYASAAMHLAKLHLANRSNSGSKSKAIHWLEQAAFSVDDKAVGGWSAGPEQPIDLLFDLLIADKNYPAAETLYRRARKEQYGKSMLAFHLKRIPGLKARIEAEEAELAQASAARVRNCVEKTDWYSHGEGRGSTVTTRQVCN